ncbi:hypothetical protein ACIPY3_10895 [Paenarthrobacter sp. NPDC089714]|uniref:hypothetical protein n=1 Tax=Paenarthrobacter sp. NPDC089714 TaxID=3364377 RepID=UPI0037FAC629
MPSPWTFLIALHAIAAGYALIFGAVNLLRRNKGSAAHKVLGRIWAVAMYVVVLTSFGIRTIDGGFNWPCPVRTDVLHPDHRPVVGR